jgi:plasmid segregation protein ParM
LQIRTANREIQLDEFKEGLPMLIAIDHGNCAIKTPNISFTSGLTDYSVRPPLALDVIEFDSRYYTLTGNRIPYMRDKTRDDRYFVLSLFAIAKELMALGELKPYTEISLAAGLPPEHYSSLKERFTRYFLRKGVKFVYNDTPVCLTISRVFVYPQAYAAVVPRARELANAQRMFIIDIGGYTTDVLLLRNGKPDLQFCRSLEMGIITMNNGIIGKVSALHDMKIEDDHIASVIENHETILPEEVKATIREAGGRHADMILDKLRELQIDLRSNPAIFIGGGSVLFRQYIVRSPLVARAEFITDPKANAAGYALLASAQMQKL